MTGPPLSEGLDPPLAFSVVFQRNTCISHSVSEFTDKASVDRNNASYAVFVIKTTISFHDVDPEY